VQWGHWFAAAGVATAATWRRVLFDRSHMAIDAAVNGIGIALESDASSMHWACGNSLKVKMRCLMRVSRSQFTAAEFPVPESREFTI
jgi:hypothetical protein